MSFQEGKRVKKFEGIPVKTEEVLADAERDGGGGEKIKSKKSIKKDKAVTQEKASAPDDGVRVQ